MEPDFPFKIISHTVPVLPLRQYPHATLDEQQDLSVSVKQYVPKHSASTRITTQPDPITIIAAGGLGFIKELYEPLFAELLSRAHNNGFSIRAIWIADMFNCGQSGVLNIDNLGCEPAWLDHARDLWSTIHHFRKDMIRPLVGLGHSMGCSQLVYLSHWHPRLFTSLVCVESGCDPEYGKGIIFAWMYQTLLRKVDFETREEAERELVRAHVAGRWDKRAKGMLIRHGVHEVEEEGKKSWKATTPKEQIAALVTRFNAKRLGLESIEGMTMEEREEMPDIDPNASNPGQFYRAELKGAWDLLPHVRPWVLYVNGEKSPFFGRAKTRDERAEITGTGVGGNGGMKLGAVSQVVIKGGEHTMVFDKQVGEVADHVALWLGKEAKRWQEGEKRRIEEWRAKSMAERQTMPDGFVEALAAQVKTERKHKL